ncbi:unnamed protein product [Arctia plantaginis]|uniref:Uncharacterized protein n=1 Tax=Arctia plantaginis TaxID=874455 RepID=A0A8S1A7G3_ARCPL|nr:unnamed protein product [Arctia plantaginis]CAB3256261.1 unnamed protein product [Arctia plantaginis]
MTLHWWMHWFWVTTLFIIIASSGRSHAAPQSEELQHITTDSELEHRISERQGRAMYYAKTPPTTQVPNVTENQTETSDTNATITNQTEVSPIQWTQVNITEVTKSIASNVTSTVAPITNLTETHNTTFTAKKRNLTRPDFVKEGGGNAAESRIVTEKTLSQETPFSQSRIPLNIESSRRIIDQGDGGMDTGAIAGISFAALVLAALAGSTAFVLYRRRYLNKPQTLNDKCSNPDSSGYLDDSTIRDNSEEMYSLDNDSFLNSLEAMTIQNYWTDTVKHTKL